MYANRILVDLMSAEADLQSAMWHGGEGQLTQIFEECLAAVGKPVNALTKRDRMKIIALLDQKMPFSFRKSVPFVAKRLQVSRYTVVQVSGGADRRRRRRRRTQGGISSMYQDQINAYFDDPARGSSWWR